ncbi:MAG: glycosyltransferase [Rothia sp. (in: high G+C Gram-positive bacteria)]|nr:glycosyltransferase [Rothia sp. (in: high G+C Gram-positive bacteria)]
MADLSLASVHLHLISMHTSPLAQPGTGDAGGMNVYIDRSLRALLKLYPQLSVEVFTLNTACKGSRSTERISDRAIVHSIYLPEADCAAKEDLPALVPAFAAAIKQESVRRPDVVHAHYWLSGLAALEYATNVPLVQTMHTTAAAKNARLGAGEKPEPQVRLTGEQKIIDELASMVVNTDFEANQMVQFYGADPERLAVIAPGVETGIFAPRLAEPAPNAGSATRAHLVFAGRPQPLKGPHILVEALGLLPGDLEVSLDIIGHSGTGYEAQLLARATQLGLGHKVHLLPSMKPRQLASAFRQADIVACPSSSETFGLVALEAQAAGTPVLATKADGLLSAVEDGATGVLVEPRTPAAWAAALEKLIRDPVARARMGAAGTARAQHMRWDDTAHRLFELYSSLISDTYTI